MRFLKYLIVLVVLLLVIGGVLLWTLPADVAYRQGAKYLGPVVLSGVRGTLWNGHADGISVFGAISAKSTGAWQRARCCTRGWRPTSASRARTSMRPASSTRADAGTMTLRDIRFRFPAQLLAPVLDIPDLNLLGVISGVLGDATLRDGFLVSASGNARWSEAGVSGEAEARFADILGDFAAQPNGGIAGTAHDDGSGNLAVTADFHAARERFRSRRTAARAQRRSAGAGNVAACRRAAGRRLIEARRARAHVQAVLSAHMSLDRVFLERALDAAQHAADAAEA